MPLHAPARGRRQRLTFLFILILAFAQLPLNALAQAKQPRRREQRPARSKPERRGKVARSGESSAGGPAALPARGPALPALAGLAAGVLNNAARLLQEDPYAEFRAATYSNAGLISERDELRLGQQLHGEVVKRYRLSSEGAERVARIGQRVARKGLRPALVYHFYVIEDREINAFSGPGGYVYATTALVRLANDDELASVLSHEVGHVVARHSLKSLQQRQAVGGLADLVGSITGVVGTAAEELGKSAAQLVGGGLLAVHSREEEREADFLGVRAMARAGFNAEGMVTMFQKLQRISQSDASLLGTLFSDHPDLQERIENTRYEIRRLRRASSSSSARAHSR